MGVLAAAELELLGIDVAEVEESLDPDAVLEAAADEADAAVEEVEAGGEYGAQLFVAGALAPGQGLS